MQYFNAARAPLKHSEYLLYAQLQEAIRTAKIFELCSGLTMHPKCFCQRGEHVAVHSYWSAIFQCSARPLEIFLKFSKNEWEPGDHMCSYKKQSERPKSLRVAVSWP
jgi:hypothetical protein